MLNLIDRLINHVKQDVMPMFFRVPISTRIADELYQAQVDLLSAEHNAEYWTTCTKMLKGRIDRLTQLQGVYPVALSSEPIQHKFDFVIPAKAPNDYAN